MISAPYCGDGHVNSWCPYPFVTPVAPAREVYCSAVFGVNRYGASVAMLAIALLVICCSGVMSTTQNDRPCVAAINSLSRGCTLRSYTGTVGKPVMNFDQVPPRSVDAYTPTDVPTNSRSRFRVSSLITCTKSGPSLGRFAAIDRSEEHTSELQSPCNLVCRLLLEKKNKKTDR